METDTQVRISQIDSQRTAKVLVPTRIQASDVGPYRVCFPELYVAVLRGPAMGKKVKRWRNAITGTSGMSQKSILLERQLYTWNKGRLLDPLNTGQCRITDLAEVCGVTVQHLRERVLPVSYGILFPKPQRGSKVIQIQDPTTLLKEFTGSLNLSPRLMPEDSLDTFEGWRFSQVIGWLSHIGDIPISQKDIAKGTGLSEKVVQRMLVHKGQANLEIREIQDGDDIEAAKAKGFWQRDDYLLLTLPNSYGDWELPRLDVEMGTVKVSTRIDHYYTGLYFLSEEDAFGTWYVVRYTRFPKRTLTKRGHQTVWADLWQAGEDSAMNQPIRANDN